MGTEWTSATSYWMPAHYVQSAWREHAPFAFWFMELLAPRTLVELGSHNGFSLFVFAEAARRLELPTRIYAIDSWEGDEHAGFYDDRVYQSVKSTRDADYSNSVELIRSYFSDAVGQFEDGTIDLLHIDGRHFYEDVQEDFETYLPKLSDRGVVLFHDVHEFNRGFGVWKLWEEVSANYPSFAFEHGHGLGVLAVGSAVSQQVLDFIHTANRHPEQVRDTYARLGAAVSRQWGELSSLRNEVKALHREVHDLRHSSSWRLMAPVRAVGSLLRRRR